MSERLLLGIDGGGTSTVACLADAEGNIIGRGVAGASNSKVVGVRPALVALESVIQAAFRAAGTPPRPVDVACLGLAGFGRAEDRQLLLEWADRIGLARQVLPVTDGDLVVAAGTPEGWGVGVIAGTGSIAVGRDRDGKFARAGGWGPLIGDEGSAYAVVLAALRRIVRRADGRGPRVAGPDPLRTHLLSALGASDVAGIVPEVHAPGMDRAGIAALAPAVLAAAREDRSIVAELLAPAGVDLAETVMAVARALGWHNGPLPLACAGGFLLASEDVLRSLTEQLERSGYTPRTTPVPEPVLGAIILARKSAHGA